MPRPGYSCAANMLCKQGHLILQHTGMLSCQEAAPAFQLSVWTERPQAGGDQVFRLKCIALFRAAAESPSPALQEQLLVMHCLVEMNSWNKGAGRALTKAIIMVSHAVKNSLQLTPNQFTPAQLLQVMHSSVGSMPPFICLIAASISAIFLALV